MIERRHAFPMFQRRKRRRVLVRGLYDYWCWRTGRRGEWAEFRRLLARGYFQWTPIGEDRQVGHVEYFTKYTTRNTWWVGA